MLALMLSILIISSLATLAGFLFERAAVSMKLSRRFAWAIALIASALMPFIPKVLPSAEVDSAIPQFTLPAIVSNAQLGTSLDYARWLWIGLAVIVVLAYVVSFARLQFVRRGWIAGKLNDEDVFFSTEFGPAVFGLVKPSIVVPDWIKASTSEEQRLILLHEQEHIRGRDHLLLLLSLAVTAWMPWNPFVWVQARRLRFCIEADCDQRVLSAAPDRARYATLLVDVGSRQTGYLLTAALAEHRNGLERRITMIAETMLRNRKKAVAFLAGGVVIAVIACESRLPSEPQETVVEQELPLKQEVGLTRAVPLRVEGEEASPNQVVTLDLKEMRPTMKEPYRTRQQAETGEAKGQRMILDRVDPEQPRFTAYTVRPDLANREEVGRALLSEYPRLLRDAGVGGTSLIWVLVAENGDVISSKISKTSGHEALDEAAIRVAAKMKFTPAENQGTKVPVWIQLPIVFKTQ